MLNKERLQQLVAGADAVIHLAAMISMKDGPDEKLIQVNVKGTQNLAEAAKTAGVKRLIHVSSAAAYEQAPYDHEPSLLGAGTLKLYRGSIPAVFPGGVDMVDVRDVAGAIASALFHGTPGSTYLLSGHFATLSQLNQLVCDVKGKTSPTPKSAQWHSFSGVIKNKKQ
jgi:dihydroflavonol-4-reductase